MAVPQPQWPQFAQMRDFVYTHTQPQWADVSTSLSMPRSRSAAMSSMTCFDEEAVGTWTPAVVRQPPLEGSRVCTACQRSKVACICTTCFVCRSRFRANRHHCRCCWNAVCSACWGHRHHVHMLGRQMLVCDRCSTPWALANLAERRNGNLLWGLYALRAAGSMPNMCIGPSCRTLTRQVVCYTCGLPTVVTRPHAARVIRSNGVSSSVMDTVGVLDVQQLSLRVMEVSGMTTAQVERMFRQIFHRYEEVFAFRAITNVVLAQRVLLSIVASAVAYEYLGAPNMTLSLSDIPYARALRISVARERYTILEAPGRVKFIAFPGTHNWRTRFADVQFASVTETVWATLHEGVRLAAVAEGEEGDSRGRAPATLNGGVRKAWEYRVHKGFAREAQEVGLPLDSLLEDVDSGGYTLLLCGHSLGGAIAQYLTLELLHRRASLLVPRGAEVDTPRVVCVSLGAPLLGNYELADHVQSCGWSHIFHNFVYRSDIVPRLSCTDELAWDAQARLTGTITSVLTTAQSWWRGNDSQRKTESVLSRAATVASDPPSTDTETVTTPTRRTGRFSTALARLRTTRTSSATSSAGVMTDAGDAAIQAGFSGETAAGAEGASLLGTSCASEDSLSWEEQARVAAYVDVAVRKGPDALESDTLTAAQLHLESAQRDADVEQALREFSSRCVRANGFGSDRRGVAHQWLPSGDEESLAHSGVGVALDTAVDVTLPAVSRRMHRRFTCFGRYHFIQYGNYGYVSTDDSETAFGVLKHGCGEASILADHSIEAYNRGVMLHLYRHAES